MSNLKRLLYLGGASVDARWGIGKIARGELGELQLERVELLVAIKEQLESNLTSGMSFQSVRTSLATFFKFFQFLDKNQLPSRLETLESNYLEFSEYLFNEVNKAPARMKAQTAYSYAAGLSKCLGQILEIPVSAALIKRTRLKNVEPAKKALGKTAEKQNLEETFALGHFLVDFIAGLTVESIYGELPLRIPIREGLLENNLLEINPVSKPSEKWFSKPREEFTPGERYRYKVILKSRQPVQSIEGTKRWWLVSFRVAAEFLVFIAQTGMNTSQALKLTREAFNYKLVGDSWEIRSYKKRRGGEVFFKIYMSYKPFLQTYLSFINHFFPKSPWLFPSYNNSNRWQDVGVRPINQINALKRFLIDCDIPWIPPQIMRNTRVNWFLRRSGDEDLTADIAQHTKKVLREKYERPSQQRAMVEITRFWNKHDPIKQGDLKGSVIASRCNGKPETIETKPTSVVEPNCTSPSGCLWCKHLRDVDSEDYVWSLASMRYLKSLEASGTLTREAISSDIVIDRLSAKIKWFSNSSKIRASWVEEAKQRVEEGHYHPYWTNIIELLV